MAILKGWKLNLMAELGRKLSKHGFREKKSEQCFKRKTSFGYMACHVSFINHVDDFDATMDVALRMDALEHLVREDDSWLNERQKKRTATMGRELGNIAGSGQKRWRVDESTDLRSVAEDMVKTFERYGLPYLERFSDPEEMLAVLSRNDEEGWKHSPIHYDRCRYAVGLAYLMGKTEQVRQNIENCRTFLDSRNEFGQLFFNALVSKIEKRLSEKH